MSQIILYNITLLMRILNRCISRKSRMPRWLLSFRYLQFCCRSRSFWTNIFTVEQRTKEIGVRKAMGSSVPGIYFVISREVFILVSISALIAWPLIYYFAGKWLENFYYRINTGVIKSFCRISHCAEHRINYNKLQDYESSQCQSGPVAQI